MQSGNIKSGLETIKSTTQAPAQNQQDETEVVENKTMNECQYDVLINDLPLN